MKPYYYNGLAINNGTAYESFFVGRLPYGLPRTNAQMLMRTGRWPLFTGLQRDAVTLTLRIFIRSGGSSLELSQYFDPEDETPYAFLVTDGDGVSNSRYVMAICTNLEEVEFSAGKEYLATLQVDGDPRFRIAAVGDIETGVVDNDTWVINNEGQDIAFPVLRIEPTNNKSGSDKWPYRIWLGIRWNSDDAAPNYLIDLGDNSFDTATLIGAAKMQADGDDIRVYVDGVTVPYTLVDINTNNTNIWVKMDFKPRQEVALLTAIAGAGAITEIEADGSIIQYPNSGLLQIDSEIFTYTGKNNFTNTFTGVTRAMRGSSAAAHTVGDTIIWIQHDVYILYGNSTASAYPDTLSDVIMNLSSSTNSSWVFANFGQNAGYEWGWQFEGPSEAKYTADRGTDADPWAEIGIHLGFPPFSLGTLCRWKFYNPCLISNVNFTNGEKYTASIAAQWNAEIMSSSDGTAWTTEDTIAEPSTSATWESWSDSEAVSNMPWVALMFRIPLSFPPPSNAYLEAADCTLTLVNPPSISKGSETANYDLDCTITNTTTGYAIKIKYPFMTVSADGIVVDCDNFTVYDYNNNVNTRAALTIVGTPRTNWLWLAPGNNTLKYNEDGSGTVKVTTEWDERYYE